MRNAYRSISIIIMAVACLCQVHAASGNSAKPLGTSQQMDVLITTKGKTTMGFLAQQPLDIHDVSAIKITAGSLDQAKSSDDGSYMIAYRRFYYFVDSSVPKYDISLQVTPMFCTSYGDGKPVKGPDIAMTVGHSDAEFGAGSGIYKLKGVATQEDAKFTNLAVNGSTILMDEKHAAHWEAFSIYADVYDSLHNIPGLEFGGKMKLIMTSR